MTELQQHYVERILEAQRETTTLLVEVRDALVNLKEQNIDSQKTRIETLDAICSLFIENKLPKKYIDGEELLRSLGKRFMTKPDTREAAKRIMDDIREEMGLKRIWNDEAPPQPAPLSEAQNEELKQFVHRMNQVQPFIQDMLLERKAQDEQWGGRAHDEGHTVAEWLSFIAKQLQAADAEAPLVYQRFVKIAALCLAAVESGTVKP